MGCEASVWDEARFGPLTEDAVRGEYATSSDIRIRTQRYEPGTSFVGSSRLGAFYVVSGACRLRFRDSSAVTLEANTYATLPEGQYELEVVGESSVEIIRVWCLPVEQRPGS